MIELSVFDPVPVRWATIPRTGPRAVSFGATDAAAGFGWLVAAARGAPDAARTGRREARDAGLSNTTGGRLAPFVDCA
jgi:hypothetical protein